MAGEFNLQDHQKLQLVSHKGRHSVNGSKDLEMPKVEGQTRGQDCGKMVRERRNDASIGVAGEFLEINLDEKRENGERHSVEVFVEEPNDIVGRERGSHWAVSVDTVGRPLWAV